ncbi:STAS domain-containing protein [Actinokineospora pegani]|uniref:STAS domain-containing protein n=1 Tax=Actinokineospora pegani TaxID=2654637 RepID=UPI0012EA0219|nr:STAS domain-containing protein [Actinokineospora pegani]
MSTARPLTTTWTTPDEHTAKVAVEGDLDFDTADALLREVAERLPGLRALHLDLAGLGFCDSYGLSVLLMVRRRAEAASASLHLDNRPGSLERLLVVTNTLDHLTGVATLVHQQTPEP